MIIVILLYNIFCNFFIPVNIYVRVLRRCLSAPRMYILLILYYIITKVLGVNCWNHYNFISRELSVFLNNESKLLKTLPVSPVFACSNSLTSLKNLPNSAGVSSDSNTELKMISLLQFKGTVHVCQCSRFENKI